MARVGYVMSHYPAISHAFVLREIEHVRAAGVDLATLSIHRTPASELLAEADRRAAATTFNVLPTSAGALLAAHVDALLRSPRRYLSTLALALRTGAPGARERLWHLFYFAEAMLALRHCRRNRIAHLHAQFADSATDVAMLVTHYRRGDEVDGRPCTWSLAVHGSAEFYEIERHALAAKLAHAAFAVAISDFGRSQLMRLTPDERWPHIHVVRCGVDLDRFVAPTERSGSSRGAELLCVGRLLHGKGLPLLLEAVARLRARGLDVRVTIAGDGPAREECVAAARRLGLDGAVRFLGAVGQDGIRELYERADVFCLPSFAEGIPVVVMEAMALELPVVTTRIMGIPELVEDGEEGILVPPGRVDPLADALERLVRSPAERRRLGEAARRKIARDYDVAASARRMRALLEGEVGLPTAPARRLSRRTAGATART
jgi:colanic acid/amylovoran biosynthesis glycosyltransferase